ncbi:class I SAM-dependent methyltransferase [Cytobacillus sp. Sa5YUA1]|uniref:Class I SAM-dependent methyltransferase n=1 Tax=Cytobacillus stercorigallinarum TaxID=2762240 RepID=A0ABR8QUM3_9BACI|nr:class I SAM-dependent methyltransferase [Cytobacillus stercorigallinarum]MBD7939221.1 class I SAM-dependent methyltransferase [Cytobacillus stercorigallinarum]
MSDHYYSKTPNVESNPRVWSYKLRDKTFQFKTDHGVFSKNEVDFGSKLLIETFIPPEISGDILDVGCGYGPIGLSMATLMQDRQVVMLDVNERALELAKTNSELNGINNITVKESDKLAVVKEHQFAAILTNPPIRAGKQTVHRIFEESFECLLPGGELWVVIQKKQGAPSAIEKLSELFAEVDTVVKKKGYFILRAKKD